MNTQPSETNDTPRVNQAVIDHGLPDSDAVDSSFVHFARTLERELKEAKAKLKAQEEPLSELFYLNNVKVPDLEKELSELREKFYVAQEVCNEVAAYGNCDCEAGNSDCIFCLCVKAAEGFKPKEAMNQKG